MKRSSYSIYALVFGIMLLTSQVVAQDDTWRPVTPEELQMKTPKVEADADVEAIFWETRIDNKKGDSVSFQHYVRVKIFTDRGRERFSKMDIPFAKGIKVEDVAVRVIKPDGSMAELKPEDIFEREIVQVGKRHIMAKSFAIPGIEPGVIVEYRYTELFKDASVNGERLIFQRDIPMERVSYFVRPAEHMALNFNAYNMPEMRFVPEKDGFNVGTMTNVPAYRTEPYMPPEDEVRKWTYLSYTNLGSMLQWMYLSSAWNEELASMAKPNKDIKAKADELTAGVTDDEEKVRRIYEFVQKHIQNLSYDRNATEGQSEKVRIKDANDVLKKGMGGAFDLDRLFASLTKAAGFETKVILAGDRSENFFNPDRYPFIKFVQLSGIAVRIGINWKTFDPGSPFLPFAMLPWYREAGKSMLIGEKGFVWGTLPLTNQAQSTAKRTGKFNLLADGTLEGEFKLEYEGHQAISRRQEQIRDSPEKREENVKSEIKERISNAEISSVTIENFDDNTKPLTYTVKLRVPTYALKTGKRLIFQPGFFEYGSPVVFSSDTRVNRVYFHYPWSSQDRIDIQLPANFELEDAVSPAAVEDGSKVGGLKVVIGINKTTNTLQYDRDFYFGGGGKILFAVSEYKAVKFLFDAFHKSDSHQLALKQK